MAVTFISTEHLAGLSKGFTKVTLTSVRPSDAGSTFWSHNNLRQGESSLGPVPHSLDVFRSQSSTLVERKVRQRMCARSRFLSVSHRAGSPLIPA